MRNYSSYLLWLASDSKKIIGMSSSAVMQCCNTVHFSTLCFYKQIFRVFSAIFPHTRKSPPLKPPPSPPTPPLSLFQWSATAATATTIIRVSSGAGFHWQQQPWLLYEKGRRNQMSHKYVLNWGGKGGGGIVSRDKRLGGQLQFFFVQLQHWHCKKN